MTGSLVRALFLAVVSLPIVAWAPVSAHGLALAPARAALPEAQVAPDESAEAAIKDLIQRANAQQEQAIASRDLTVMKDTSADRYYREMLLINQSILDSGITSVTLLKIEWGPITIIDNTATATTDETWIVTLVDGTTLESRDRNVYYLVRQNGKWLVEANEHPGDSVPVQPGDQQVWAPGNSAGLGGGNRAG